MIRTHIITCNLNQDVADTFNLESGRIYTQVLVSHWRALRKKGIWFSQYEAMALNDFYNPLKALHAHTIDAAQEGFYKAVKTVRVTRKIDPAARFPHWPKKFRTTIWKQTAIKRHGDTLILSNGRGNDKISIALPDHLIGVLRVLEIRLVYDKKSRRYRWHIVAEDGKMPNAALGNNVVSVDLGEIHPAVVGDEDEATIITMRQLRSEKQGHAKRLAKINKAIAQTKKGSRQRKKLVRSRNRMKAKHRHVVRDMEHKISRAVVDIAVEREAGTIVIGDVRNVANRTKKDKRLNRKTRQKVSQWSHGQVRGYIAYKAEAEGIATTLQDERYTSQTCPSCQHRHKPRGRVYRCPSCRFQTHRDIVGQVNILSAHKHGTPGKIPAPTTTKYRIPHNLRVMRRRRDTGQTNIVCL